MISKNKDGVTIEGGVVVRLSEAKTKEGLPIVNVTVKKSAYDKESKTTYNEYVDVAFCDNKQNDRIIENATALIKRGVKAGDPIFYSAKMQEKQGEGNKKYWGYASVTPRRYENNVYPPTGVIYITDGNGKKKGVVVAEICNVSDEIPKFEDGKPVLDENGDKVMIPMTTMEGKPKLQLSANVGKNKWFKINLVNTKFAEGTVDAAKKCIRVENGKRPLVYFTVSEGSKGKNNEDTTYFVGFSFQVFGTNDKSKGFFLKDDVLTKKEEEDEEDDFIPTEEPSDIPFFEEPDSESSSDSSESNDSSDDDDDWLG